MDNEDWRRIPGFPQHEVSNLGRVRGPRGIRKLNTQNAGYHTVTLTMAKGSTKLVHSLVCLAFLGEMPKGHCVNHKNGIKTDNRLENLEYVTRSQNNLDWRDRMGIRVRREMRQTGHARGESHGMAKHTEEQIRAVHELSASGLSRLEIARKTGIGYFTVRSALNGSCWIHLHPVYGKPTT